MKTAFLMIMFTLFVACSCTKTIIEPAKETPLECYPDVTLNGVNYSLSPCTINETMIHGNGDKPFTVTINTSILNQVYGFSVFGYGVGFPTYGIMGVSGGAQGVTQLNLSFTDKVLQKGIYNGYLPIHVYTGSEMGGEDSTHYLKLKIVLTVK